MPLILLLVLIAAGVAACLLLSLIARARNKRLLVASMRGTSCDAPNGIGVSVLCSGVTDADQLENLLSVGYSRYEVIVVLDARRFPEAFASLVARYRMIRVEWTPTGELPADGVRSVGRSRKRCYRRLVVVDRAQDDPAADFDAGAGVAAYDLLLPLTGGQQLLPGAVERLVAELGEGPVGGVDLVQSRLGEPVRLLAREAVVRAGGFSVKPWRAVPRERRRTLWEPLVVRSAAARRVPWGVSFAAAILFVFGTVSAAAAGRWPLAALLMTAALVWCAAACAVQLASSIPGVAGRSLFLSIRHRVK